ncbi:GNAT family N-acetyltransferase [Brevibacillus gelatini]
MGMTLSKRPPAVKPKSFNNKTAFDLQKLHKSCSLTPLPHAILTGAVEGWRHNAIYMRNELVAAASLQKLQYAPDGSRTPTSLLCSVSVRPDWQGKGLGKKIIDGLLKQADTQNLIALVEVQSNSSLGFFEKQGWIKTKHTAQVAQWC